MKKFVCSLALLLTASSFAQASCLEDMSSSSAEKVARYETMLAKKQLTKTEFNALISGAASLVEMHANTCIGIGQADFTQDQVEALMSSISSHRAK